MPVRQIITLGGGGFSMEPDNPLLDRFILSRARQSSRRLSSNDEFWAFRTAQDRAASFCFDQPVEREQ